MTKSSNTLPTRFSARLRGLPVAVNAVTPVKARRPSSKKVLMTPTCTKVTSAPWAPDRPIHFDNDEQDDHSGGIPELPFLEDGPLQQLSVFVGEYRPVVRLPSVRFLPTINVQYEPHHDVKMAPDRPIHFDNDEEGDPLGGIPELPFLEDGPGQCKIDIYHPAIDVKSGSHHNVKVKGYLQSDSIQTKFSPSFQIPSVKELKMMMDPTKESWSRFFDDDDVNDVNDNNDSLYKAIMYLN